MQIDPKYMYRCLQLASCGRGYTTPNPMVGAVVVYKGRIIGEGYHRKSGEAHAEVNAINSVKDKSLLRESTLYVSLEPCSHYGKTPPCAQLIIDSKIPRVVIGSLDPFPKVSGRGVRMLQNANVEVAVGLLKEECDELNKEFITAYTKNRPYVYLKWAQSRDSYMDRRRTSSEEKPAIISNDFTKTQVHKLRAEVDAIMVGTNTAVLDNPTLTTRFWCGKNPVRVILDRKLRIPMDSNIYNGQVRTYIITEKDYSHNRLENVEFIRIDFNSHFLETLMRVLRERDILSIMIEGGSQFLQHIIDEKMWDEAFVEVGNEDFMDGVKAPIINGILLDECHWKSSRKFHFHSLHA